jgi:hypothetical protein
VLLLDVLASGTFTAMRRCTTPMISAMNQGAGRVRLQRKVSEATLPSRCMRRSIARRDSLAPAMLALDPV